MSQDKEVIDIEAYAKEGKPVPHDREYKIKVDKSHYTVPAATMKGRDILILAGKNPPERYILQQKVKDQIKRIGLDEVVDFTAPGVERFMTIPNEVTEGEAPAMRCQFDPMKDDLAYLQSLGLPWEAVLTVNVKRILIHGFPIPKGYNVEKASVFVVLSPGYPDTQIDMAYFSPSQSRADGKPIRQLSETAFDGKSWQQWSRHRTSASAWRIGEDNLSTHMGLVADWLDRELSK
jgi:hypothetical protein